MRKGFQWSLTDYWPITDMFISIVVYVVDMKTYDPEEDSRADLELVNSQ